MDTELRMRAIELRAEQSARALDELRERMSALDARCVSLADANDRLRAALAAARTALERYAEHRRDCELEGGISECTCGLDDALRALDAASPPKP
jgi:hypothetical protein